MMKRNPYYCIFCESNDTRIIGKSSDFPVNIFKCNHCGLIQCEHISDSYLQEYYKKKYRNYGRNINDNYKKILKNRASSQYDFIKKYSNNNIIDKKVIDIGAGLGFLLEEFSKSNELFAAEYDELLINHIQKAKNIKFLYKNQYLTDKYNMVLLSHVFEHVSNPIVFLHQMHDILLDDGLLFIEVPNEPITIVEHNIKKKVTGLSHTFNYTPKTLKSMITNEGLFELIYLGTFGQSLNEYLKVPKIYENYENDNHDGIFIRCLLRKNKKSYHKDPTYYLEALNAKYQRFSSIEKENLKLKEEIKELREKVTRQHQALEKIKKEEIKELREKVTRQHQALEKIKNESSS